MTILRVIKKISESKYKYMGNGFIINDKGLMITAGHVLKNHETQTHIALELDSYTPLEIKILYFEHEEIYKQKPTNYKDLAICRITKKNNTIPITRNCSAQETVYVKGFLNENTSKEFSLSDKEKIDNIKVKIGYSNVLFTESMMSDLPKEVKDREHANPDRFFDNVISIKRVLKRGISGSPVFTSDDQICGMFIGSDTIDYENPKSYAIKIGYIKDLIQKMKLN